VTPRLSVVIPFHGAERWIERCVEGVLSQAYPREAYEVLLVDNNSSDGSAGIVERYPGVTLLHEPAQSAYAARNRGARAARGDILVFTDADCVPRGDWLASMSEAMRDPRVELVVGSVTPGGDSPLVNLLGAYEDVKARHIVASGDARLYVGHAGNMAMRRATFDRCGPFVEWRRGSDTTLVRRVVDSRSCGAVRYEPGAAVEHLEVERPADYLAKVFTYGRSYRHYRRLNGCRPLTSGKRLRLLGATMRRERPTPLDGARLSVVLLVGLGCWLAGSAVGLRDAFSAPATLRAVPPPRTG